jgi:hypothetical protein
MPFPATNGSESALAVVLRLPNGYASAHGEVMRYMSI